jgi:hypothetical protein
MPSSLLLKDDRGTVEWVMGVQELHIDACIGRDKPVILATYPAPALQPFILAAERQPLGNNMNTKFS